MVLMDSTMPKRNAVGAQSWINDFIDVNNITKYRRCKMEEMRKIVRSAEIRM